MGFVVTVVILLLFCLSCFVLAVYGPVSIRCMPSTESKRSGFEDAVRFGNANLPFPLPWVPRAQSAQTQNSIKAKVFLVFGFMDDSLSYDT